MFKFSSMILFTLLAVPVLAQNHKISPTAANAAHYAAQHFQQPMIDSLTRLVSFNTVAKDGVAATDNPVHQAFKRELEAQAHQLGLDFTDHGYLVIIGLGNGSERVGMITHGDVQPATPEKWAQSPFLLDMTSEPGRLIGRGTEDDKASISNALFAMNTIKALNIALKKRIELYVYMAEESDWQPLQEFIKQHTLPEINITLDAEYPVVTAEKGYGTISLGFPLDQLSSEQIANTTSSYLSSFSGGFFGSQIPEDAKVIIANAEPQLPAKLQKRAATHVGMRYDYQWQDNSLIVNASGKSAHSSKPEDGVNAISHLADLLAIQRWPNNASGALVNFINDQLGTGLYGEKFGDIAFQDDFMGPMTVQATVLSQDQAKIELNINLRSPSGKSTDTLEQQIKTALAHWQQQNKFTLQDINITLSEPFVQTNAPQIDTLLKVFSYYTGIEQAKPVAIGGGTNSRLFPNAVSFGPTMPGKEYTGHSEHEFITLEQFMLNLKMYTAVLVELAKN